MTEAPYDPYRRIEKSKISKFPKILNPIRKTAAPFSLPFDINILYPITYPPHTHVAHYTQSLKL